MIVASITNLPQVECPVGQTLGGQDCKRIAFLYLKTGDSLPVIQKGEGNKQSNRKERTSAARKISASLAHEKKMLSLVDVFAILPAP